MPRVAIFEIALDTRSGLSYPPGESAGDTVNNQYFVWGANKILSVRNPTGGSLNITFVPQSTQLDGFTAPSKTVAVPASSQMLIGPFISAYSHPEDGDRVYVNPASASLQMTVLNSSEFN
jgi:hypothetical protein